MVNRLFAYGTLRQGTAPAGIAEAVRRLRPLGSGMAWGRLYDLGEYPGMIFGGAEAEFVAGEVYEVPDAALWAELDAYEGFDPASPESSLFVRKMERVRLVETGAKLLCWVYEYRRAVREDQRVVSDPDSQ